MKSGFLVLALLAYCSSPAMGWGYLFSRFRPEAGNWGYGHNSDFTQRNRDQLLNSLAEEEMEDSCEGRRCTANEHCCDQHLCVEFDGASGTCMAYTAQPEGAECTVDAECQAGLMCEIGVCSAPLRKKNYYEPCSTSAECDIERSLCCQLIRRHRQTPRKVCVTFKNPMSCIGHVASQEQVKRTAPAH